jgi:hypothetical protein
VFPLCRQVSLPSGGKPDILALDSVRPGLGHRGQA